MKNSCSSAKEENVVARCVTDRGWRRRYRGWWGQCRSCARFRSRRSCASAGWDGEGSVRLQYPSLSTHWPARRSARSQHGYLSGRSDWRRNRNKEEKRREEEEEESRLSSVRCTKVRARSTRRRLRTVPAQRALSPVTRALFGSVSVLRHRRLFGAQCPSGVRENAVGSPRSCPLTALRLRCDARSNALCRKTEGNNNNNKSFDWRGYRQLQEKKNCWRRG